MTDENNEDTPDVQANNQSIAVGSISAGGNIGDIHIGNTNIYNTPEDDIPLSSDEIENGLTRLIQYLPERAPILQDQFSSISKKLRTTLGADLNSLSPVLKSQREDGVNRMKLMCMEVTDISFRAMCLGQNPPPYDSRPPFLGLFAFHPEDREFFFGREKLVQTLVASIKQHPFLAVLGASGSGKSSLVMAGLIPALEAQMSYLTPSSAPVSLLRMAKEASNSDTVFVIDQFEELFTHPHSPAERAEFIQQVLELIETNRVLITMRADFWGEIATYPELKQAMQDHQELIAPMNTHELHAAMEKQAAVVSLRFDPALSTAILDEVKGEPGAMPLLQHALWELWNRRHGLWIKAEEYQAFGGVKQAIASTAEKVYASCSEVEQDRVRDIFLRLTRLDEGNEGRDTRRRVRVEELTPSNSDPIATTKLLNKLADARLIVKTGQNVEVAHEALIRHWSRLTTWLNQDRDNLRLREGVSENAREWDEANRDDSLLNHRGGRLELALAMSKLPRYQLNPREQAYLNACVALRNKEQRERERRLRYTVFASITSAVIFLVLGSFGWIKSNEATNQAKVTLARQLAAQAQSIYTSGNPKQEIAALLAVRSIQLFPVFDAVQVLQTKTLAHLIAQITHDNHVTAVAFSPDGKYVVSGSIDGIARVWKIATGLEISHVNHFNGVVCVGYSTDGKYIVSGGNDRTIRVWEALTGQEIANMTHNAGVTSVAFSHDGKYVISGGNDRIAHVWESMTGKEIAHMKHDGSVTSVAFSPDGKYAVSGSLDGTARVWKTATGMEIARMTFNDGVTSVAFSPDGKYVVAGSYDYTARIWDASTGQEIARRNHNGAVFDVAFSPEGNFVVSGGYDNAACVWYSTTGKGIACSNHNDGVIDVAFSPNGKYVVSGSKDGTTRIWKANSGVEVNHMNYDDSVSSVAFSPDGKYVASGGYDKTVRIWEATNGVEVANLTLDSNTEPNGSHSNGKYSVVLECDKSESVPNCKYKTASILDAATGMEVSSTTYEGWVTTTVISSEGKYVASGGCDETSKIASSFGNIDICIKGTTRVWNTMTGVESARLTNDGLVTSVAFSPDSTYAVSGGCDEIDNKYICIKGIARIFEAATGVEVARMIYDDEVAFVAFSPDGRYVISGGFDGSARKWIYLPEDLIANTCSHISRNLTRIEWAQYIGDALPYQMICPMPQEPGSTPVSVP